ncbi:MAG TPA: ABC transporter ATP-binding protein [Anaerolineales bacterium]|nr:ABC transporter ATP-binding protein [Anaerolineales bacterium]
MNQALPLAVDELTFRYRDRASPAIRNLTFEAYPGEILLIAGASGCGKTTLIRAINGLVPRSYKGELSGRVQVFGEDTGSWRLSAISQRVGTVLQDPERQILGTKVVGEVAFGLENLGLDRAEIRARVDEALALLRISQLRDRDTFSLSGGEKQKVALAGVLAMRPSILLLDEPLASLDPASAQDSLDMVRRLADEGMTVLLVEHRVEDVLRIRPDRVMFMNDGQIRYLGPVEGISAAVNYHEVKLPAKDIVARARKEARPRHLQFLPGASSSSQAGDALVQFQGVSFGYETEGDVLRDINLEIRRGDVIAVLGANGAGKTTMVKHAIGLLKPRTGRVLVEGRDTREASVAQIAATLGYVFQSPSHMLFAPSVREELEFGPTNLKHAKPQIEKEVKEALEIVNLADKENDPPLALSFGQQKRVSIAAILAMRSRILVMDEPTAGQDYQNYMNFMDSILQMPGFSAVMFITHEVDLAVIYANRVLLMGGGRLIADGRPEVVLRDFEQLQACRLVPSSLLALNVERLPQTGAFMRAEALAHL